MLEEVLSATSFSHETAFVVVHVSASYFGEGVVLVCKVVTGD